mmetsp:Transcript_10859/g.34342  ORF Transcript_10859/g.34342 Transcript_10859/m.34342 type:complete len:137 (+) Transcript_10859:413-823(+)
MTRDWPRSQVHREAANTLSGVQSKARQDKLAVLQQLLDSGRTLSEEQRLNLSAEAAAAGQLAASLSAEARKWQGTIDNAGPYQLEQLRLSKAAREWQVRESGGVAGGGGGASAVCPPPAFVGDVAEAQPGCPMACP